MTIEVQTEYRKEQRIVYEGWRFKDPETGVEYGEKPTYEEVIQGYDSYYVRCPTCNSKSIDPTSSDARVEAALRSVRNLEDSAGASRPEHPERRELPPMSVAGCFMWIPAAILTGLVVMLGSLFALLSVAWSEMSIVFGLLTVISMLLFVVGVFVTIVLAIRGIQGKPEETKRFQEELDNMARIEEEHERRVEQARKKREALEATKEYQFLKNQVDVEFQELMSNLGFRCRACGCSFTHSKSEIPDLYSLENCELYIRT